MTSPRGSGASAPGYDPFSDFRRERAIEKARWDCEEAAARAANWRDAKIEDAPLPGWLVVPTYAELNIDGPIGTHAIDEIALKLLARGKVALPWLEGRDKPEWAAVHSLRILLAFSFEGLPDLVRAGAQTARRAHATHIGARLGQLEQDLSGLLQHACDSSWYVGPKKLGLAQDETQESEDASDEAEQFVEQAKGALELARSVIAEMQSRVEPQPYQHNGAENTVATIYLRLISAGWASFTFSAAGRTRGGMFNQLCNAGWQFLGWPDSARPDFASLIARGRHLWGSGKHKEMPSE